MRRYFPLFAAACCLALVLIWLFSREAVVSSEETHQVERSFAAHGSVFVEPQEFFRLVSRVKSETRPMPGKVVGGVVPHHLLAGDMIGSLFSLLVEEPPATVAVVGPNHFAAGGRILTGRYGWETPSGVVQPDLTAIQYLLDSGLVALDDQVLSGEHSIGAVVPFLKHYLPEARVIPLILQADVTLAEVSRLAQLLLSIPGGPPLIVASVDFSHYLTRPEADRKDRETLAALRAFDLPRLFTMGNDHLDSPPAIGLLFQAMAEKGIKTFDVLAHNNSGVILGNDLIETTSYFTLAFFEDLGEKE
ncbi:MAG: AmmeMemoRadiSam system protein B [Bacillota bacterium]